MPVYLGQHQRAPLKELARSADTLMKIADMSVKTTDSTKYKPNLFYQGPIGFQLMQ